MRKINEFENMHPDYSQINDGYICYKSDIFQDSDDKDYMTVICCTFLSDISDWVVEAITGNVAATEEHDWELMFPESVAITTELLLAIIADCLEHTKEVTNGKN